MIQPSPYLRRAPEGGVDLAAHDDRGRAVRHVRAHAAGVSSLLARPQPLHLVEHLVEAPTAVLERDTGGREVVLSPAGRHPEDETTAGQGVDASPPPWRATAALGRDGAIRIEVTSPMRSVTAAAAASDTSGS